MFFLFFKFLFNKIYLFSILFFVRPWGADVDAVASTKAVDDAHREHVGKGNWVDVFFCFNGTEFPPRSTFYLDLEFSEMQPFSVIHDRMQQSIVNMMERNNAMAD